ncbi:hypothetical protein KSP35_22075 [Aquihabitans sp. G128]|uniref:hypothetical protein n=1 Tax=Aquihabitans sp. G128 TaxID=2849779 RepID=UPI001C21E6B1|nr:hypothetical protein [Aquihabitans sp. G128]QXC60968.1 hypothetical protein KSP35_22075 [Aquihabitans sp. G128]
MTSLKRGGHEPLDPGEDVIQDDLHQVKLVNSAGFNNTWAVLGPASLVLIPVAAVLTAIKRMLQGRD